MHDFELHAYKWDIGVGRCLYFHRGGPRREVIVFWLNGVARFADW